MRGKTSSWPAASSQGRAEGQVLISSGATGPKGSAWSCDRRGSSWVLGKISSLRQWSVVRALNLSEFKKHLVNSQTYGLISGWSCMKPGDGLNSPCGTLPAQASL